MTISSICHVNWHNTEQYDVWVGWPATAWPNGRQNFELSRFQTRQIVAPKSHRSRIPFDWIGSSVQRNNLQILGRFA